MMPLALLIPGGKGQLGHDLAANAPTGSLLRTPDLPDLDISQARQVVQAIDDLVAAAGDLPPVVINAAAYTAVDAAESAQEKAFAVNADGPRLLAAVCSSRQVPLIHVSTDYVFSGEKPGPYEVDDPVGPRSVYGTTKLAGENAVLRSGAEAWVVRTAWVYGVNGNNFVKTIARLAAERPELSVVDDQRGSPTWSNDLAVGLLELAELVVSGRGPAGRVLHATGSGDTTWYGFAQAILEELGDDPTRVKPTTTENFPRPAERPKNSVLSSKAWVEAGLTPLPPWRDALRKAFQAGLTRP